MLQVTRAADVIRSQKSTRQNLESRREILESKSDVPLAPLPFLPPSADPPLALPAFFCLWFFLYIWFDLQKSSTDSFKTIRLSPSTLLYFLVAFQDVVAKRSSHVSEFQEREMKGKQDIGGKNVFFQQIFEVTDECRWRWSKAVPDFSARSLLAGEHLRVVKGQGPCQRQPSVNKEGVFFVEVF